MKFEIEIPDAELRNAIYQNGYGVLKSAKVPEMIRAAASDQIGRAIAEMDISAAVKDEIDATVAKIIQNGVNGRLRAIIRPLIEQECERLRGEAAIAKATPV